MSGSLFDATDAAGLDALLGGDAVLERPEKWPKLLAEMVDVVEAALRRRGTGEERSGELARVAIGALAEYHGGGSFYLPMGESLKAALRDDAIWRAFGRTPVAEIARHHGISLQHCYRVIAEQRALHGRRAQPDLFDAPAAKLG